MNAPRLLMLGFFFLVASCATGRGGRARSIVMEPMFIGAEPDEQLGLAEFDAATLLRKGLERQRQNDCRGALPFYERLLEQFPESRYLSAAALNAGVCAEQTGNDERAVRYYSIITEKLTHSKDYVLAAFRQAGCLRRLGKTELAEKVLAAMLDRDALEVPDRIEALLERADCLVELGRPYDAERWFMRALVLFRRNQRQLYLDPALGARALFGLGMLAEQRFRDAPLRMPEERLEQDLERKAGYLLEAQSAYLRAIRQGDPEWAARAGWRIAGMYIELREHMLRAPVPEDLSSEEKKVYLDMLRRRTAVLLRKALRMLEQTISFAERTGLEPEWLTAARNQLEKIEKELLDLDERSSGLNPAD